MNESTESDPAQLRSAVLSAERPALINLAYRMLGSLTEAEDAVRRRTPAGWP